jgi:hypothetical protein
MATKKKTKTKTPTMKMPSLTTKICDIQEMLECLASDIYDGNITTNEISDRIEEITVKIENFQDYL